MDQHGFYHILYTPCKYNIFNSRFEWYRNTAYDTLGISVESHLAPGFILRFHQFKGIVMIMTQIMIMPIIFNIKSLFIQFDNKFTIAFIGKFTTKGFQRL